MRLDHRFTAALLVTGSLAAAAHPGVTVVSYSESLQAAIDAASDGDVIVLKYVTTFPVTIDNKSLVLQGDGTLGFLIPQNCEPLITVSNLAAGKRVVLRGLSLPTMTCSPPSSQFFSSNSAFRGVNNEGSIWIDHVGGQTVGLENCREVVITHSGITTLNVTSNVPSHIFAHHSTFVGVKGGNAGPNPYYGWLHPIPGQPGQRAITASGPITFDLTECNVLGGTGGDGLDSYVPCLPPGPGGSAIALGTGGPIFRSIASTIQSGLPGTEAPGCPPLTSSEPSVNIQTGSFFELPGDPSDLGTNSPIREQQTFDIDVEGTPGSFALLLVSLQASSVWMAPHAGALHVAPPFLVVPLGTLPDPPNLFLNIPVPDLPVGILGVNFFTQAATCPAGLPCALSPPASILILDSSL